MNKTKSRSFSAVPRSAHTEENTQVPEKDNSSQTCTDENIHKFRTRWDKPVVSVQRFVRTDENSQVQDTIG